MPAVSAAEKRERARLIDRHISANGLVVLDPMGPHPEHLKWEKRQMAKRSRNSQRDKASRGKAAYSPFFKRGGGCV